MKRFWLLRSNLKSLEYYHKYKDLSSFITKCHDYYMLLPLWMLQAGYADEVTIWRLSDAPKQPIVFDVENKKYIQRWVKDFKELFDYPKPDMTFFRGGFKEYDKITKDNKAFFSTSLYLGAGQRINAKWGGKYDMFLMEDDRDLKNNPNTYPFYKTASPFIFHLKPSTVIKWDICWPCNFTQLNYKGQEFFIREISRNKELQKLKIVHCGNKPEVGKSMCNKYNVKNIKFLGSLHRVKLNEILNSSKFGLNLSNQYDGCPRVSTEVLMSGTPLIIHEKTRLLSYYKKRGVVEINHKNIVRRITDAIKNYTKYRREVIQAIEDELSFDKTNQKNIEVWLKNMDQ